MPSVLACQVFRCCHLVMLRNLACSSGKETPWLNNLTFSLLKLEPICTWPGVQGNQLTSPLERVFVRRIFGVFAQYSPTNKFRLMLCSSLQKYQYCCEMASLNLCFQMMWYKCKREMAGKMSN